MSSYLKYLRQMAQRQWPTLAAYCVLGLAILAASLFRLKTTVPGYSASEITTYHLSDSFKMIWQQPFNAPFEILVRGLRYLEPHDLVVVRLASVLVGLIMLACFGWVMTRWHGTRTALMGTALFGLSASLLHVTRLGSPSVMFLGLFPLVICGMWLRERQTAWAAFLILILCAVLLYTPGMVWFLLLGLMLQWSTIDKALKKNPVAASLGSALFLALLAPLAWHLYKQHAHELMVWLAMPTQWHDIWRIVHSIYNVPLAIFIHRADDDPYTAIGRLPLLSAFASVMFIAGCYLYVKRLGLVRVRLFLLISLLGMTIIGLGQSAIPFTPLLPFIFAIVTAGLGYIIDRWYIVFPRNPIAQGFGIGIALLALGITIFYNLDSYFIAWSQTAVTHSLFLYK